MVKREGSSTVTRCLSQVSLHRAELVLVWKVRDSWTRRSHFLGEVRELRPARRLRDQRGAAEILTTLKL